MIQPYNYDCLVQNACYEAVSNIQHSLNIPSEIFFGYYFIVDKSEALDEDRVFDNFFANGNVSRAEIIPIKMSHSEETNCAMI